MEQTKTAPLLSHYSPPYIEKRRQNVTSFYYTFDWESDYNFVVH